MQVAKISLDVKSISNAKDEIQLFQNEPNPFRNQTTVSYYMPFDATVTIKLHDVSGRLLVIRKLKANKGFNNETFSANEIRMNGVLYYTLESGNYASTKKMIIVE